MPYILFKIYFIPKLSTMCRYTLTSKIQSLIEQLTGRILSH